MEAGKFSFYRSFHDAVKWLEPTKRLAMYDAMCMYAFSDSEPSFEDPMLTMAWTLIRPLIESSKKGQANGAKGGNGRGHARGENPRGKTPLKPPLKTPPENPIRKEIEGKDKTTTGFIHSPADCAGADGAAQPADWKAVFDEVDGAAAETLRQREAHDEMVSAAIPCPEGLNPFKAAAS